MFKIGDRVRIKSKNIVGNITKINEIGNYIETENNVVFLYRDDNLELVTEAPQPEQAQPEYKRQPLGITPQWLWKEQRIKDIIEAFKRYFDSGDVIPLDWLTEYNELVRGE